MPTSPTRWRPTSASTLPSGQPDRPVADLAGACRWSPAVPVAVDGRKVAVLVGDATPTRAVVAVAERGRPARRRDRRRRSPPRQARQGRHGRSYDPHHRSRRIRRRGAGRRSPTRRWRAFVQEAYRHHKTIAFLDDGMRPARASTHQPPGSRRTRRLLRCPGTAPPLGSVNRTARNQGGRGRH